MDRKNASEVGKKLRNKQNLLNQLASLESQQADIQTLIDLCESEDDKELYGELTMSLADFEKKCENLKIITLLSGKYDSCNAIMNIHAGQAELRLRIGRICFFACIACMPKNRALNLLF